MKSIIYYGGDIITVDETTPSAEAVFIKDGKIISVGKKEEVFKLKEEDTEMYDLEGKTLLPGFVDSHSHLTGVVKQVSAANLFSQPLGPINNIEDLKDVLKKFKEERQIGKDGWIVGLGYDQTRLEEKRHPNKFDLDEVSTEVPVFAIHFSAHQASLNSKCLEVMGINSETKNPYGGVIQRIEGSTEPDGRIEETVVREVLSKMPVPSIEQSFMLLDKAQDIYLSNGITTVNDALVKQDEYNLLTGAAKTKRLKLDVIGLPGEEFLDTCLNGYDFFSGEYQNNFRLGGGKDFLDGGLPGKTAWLTEPYINPPVGEDNDYRGYPTHTDEEVYEFFKKCLQNDCQPFVHSLGDAAIDQFLRCYEKALKDSGNPKDVRPVAIHCTVTREEQLDKMKELDIIPSFQNNQTYYYGDYNVNYNIGKERSYNNIAPLASVIKRNIQFTLHQDSPVTPPYMLHSIWAAVTRKSFGGEIIGPDQRISVMDAIKAATINGAYQYFEEDVKGSITVGKKADLVILDKNPLKVDPLEIKDIQVLETIKDGETVFKK